MMLDLWIYYKYYIIGVWGQKLKPIIADDETRMKYMGYGQIGFVLGAGTEIHIHRLLKRIAIK